MKRVIFVMILVVCTLTSVFAGGSGEVTRFAGDYEFGGSTTLEPIFMATIEYFAEIYNDLNISYDSQGSSVGVRGALNGTYSLGGSSRELKKVEIDDGAIAIPIALDGVAVIVNKSSINISNLSIEEIVKIYSGEITNWEDVGGPEAEIVIYNRDEASGTRSCFGDSTVKLIDTEFTNTAAIVSSNGDMVSKVGSTPFAIGYCGFGYIEKDPGTKAITVDKVEPYVENVLNDTYKISRKLNIISNSEIKEETFEKTFVEFLLSESGQAIVEEEGFIPIK